MQALIASLKPTASQRKDSSASGPIMRFGSFLIVTLLVPAGAFQLSMVSTSPSPSRSFSAATNPLKSSGSSILNAPFSTAASALAGGFSLSSGLISQLAIMALKARLANQQSVDCDVTAKPMDLMQGRVGPVTVKGRGWQSGLGLTCRAIEATVDACELDTRRVLMDRKLVLTTPAKGTAMIALNAADFANFITHPRMRPPSPPTVEMASSAPLRFLKEGTRIDPTSGTVIFYADFAGKRWRCLLKRGGKNQPNAVVQVVPASSNEEHDPSASSEMEVMAQQLTSSIGRFFNEMVFELDGTFLSFRDMMVTGKGPSPSVMLSLSIKVHKLPSRSLAF